MAFYPQIRDEQIMVLNAVTLNMEKDGGYLDSPECPYSDQIKAFFRKKIDVSAAKGGEIVDLFEGEDQLGLLEDQIKALINDLESYGKKLEASDSTEKMAYFRTKTALIEKLVNMRERVFTIKEINDFRSTVIAFMNESLTKDQITAFMKRLDGVLGTSDDDI